MIGRRDENEGRYIVAKAISLDVMARQQSTHRMRDDRPGALIAELTPRCFPISGEARRTEVKVLIVGEVVEYDTEPGLLQQWNHVHETAGSRVHAVNQTDSRPRGIIGAIRPKDAHAVGLAPRACLGPHALRKRDQAFFPCGN